MILDIVKTNLRLTDTTFDEDEVSLLISACKKDMRAAGINPAVLDSEDALVVQAIVLYCKGSFGYQTDNGRFIETYEKLKATMASSLLYREGGSY